MHSNITSWVVCAADKGYTSVWDSIATFMGPYSSSKHFAHTFKPHTYLEKPRYYCSKVRMWLSEVVRN